MIVYNITSNVAHEVIDEWISWLNNILIPEIMEVGVFNDFKFFQLLDIDETEGKTYTIQFFCDNELRLYTVPSKPLCAAHLP